MSCTLDTAYHASCTACKYTVYDIAWAAIHVHDTARKAMFSASNVYDMIDRRPYFVWWRVCLTQHIGLWCIIQRIIFEVSSASLKGVNIRLFEAKLMAKPGIVTTARYEAHSEYNIILGKSQRSTIYYIKYSTGGAACVRLLLQHVIYVVHKKWCSACLMHVPYFLCMVRHVYVKTPHTSDT